VEWLRGRVGQLARALGFLLTIASIAVIGVQISNSSSSFSSDFRNPAFVGAIIAAIPAYACFCVLAALAWTLVVRGLEHNENLSIPEGLIVFGRAQILKYLPSNVLHFVGRHAMARSTGVSHSSLLLSSGAEIALQLVAACAIALTFGFPIFAKLVLNSIGESLSALILLAALIALTLGALFWLRYQNLLKARLVYHVTAAVALYVCFFLLAGGILIALLFAAAGTLEQPRLIIGVNTSAWLVGFVVPGAPAGIGIREVVLTSGLKLAGNAGPSALAAAIGYRIVTFGGDVVVALVSLALNRALLAKQA